MIWLLAGYMWLYIHRPFEFWNFLGDLRIERVYMICLIAVWMVYPNKTFVPNRLHFAFGWATLAILVCWMATPYSSAAGEYVWEYQWKVCVLFFLLITVIHTEEQLWQLLTAFFVILTLYQLHSLWEFMHGRYEYRMATVRMKGIDRTHGDPNTFAATLLHAMPFLLPFWFDDRARKLRPWIVSYVGLNLLCIMLTGSRRAFAGLAVFTVLLIWRSQRRWTYFLLLMLMAPIGFAMLRDDLQNRFLTLIDPSLGPQNAQQSSNFRWQAFSDGWRLFNDHLLTGTGPGSFTYAAGHNLKAHNLYAQTMSEMGLMGITSLGLMVLCFWLNARETTRLYRQHGWEPDFVYHVGRNGWTAVVLLLFMGLGGHNLFRYNWLWFGAFQLLAVHVARQRARNEAFSAW